MPSVAFLFDVDNTLLDNDRVKADLVAATDRLVGPERGERFWQIYEEVREDLDYVDLPGTLGRFAEEFPEDRGFPALADHVLSYPYHTAVYRGALEVLKRASARGPTAILSDGDPVFQPAKIARARIAAAILGPILVYTHKEENLDEVRRRVPADRYVLIDDKRRILLSVREQLGDAVTTVHVSQGRHADDGGHPESADVSLTIGSIAEMLDYDLAAL